MKNNIKWQNKCLLKLLSNTLHLHSTKGELINYDDIYIVQYKI